MEKQTLSPHELNKYTYCPYQWYFEKVYGQKELRRLYGERNKRLGLTDTQKSRFVAGEAFHTENYRRYRLQRRLWKIIFVVLLLIFVVLAVKYGLA